MEDVRCLDACAHPTREGVVMHMRMRLRTWGHRAGKLDPGQAGVKPRAGGARYRWSRISRPLVVMSGKAATAALSMAAICTETRVPMRLGFAGIGSG